MLKQNKKIVVVFCLLILNFLFILGQFFIPQISDFFQGSLFFLLPFVVFSFLGGLLAFLTVKEKVEDGFRKFLLLTGGSSFLFLISVLLHNFFYALGILTEDIFVLRYLFEFLHGGFFIIGVLVCPLGFLIGVVGSIGLFFKLKNSSGL